MFEYLPTEINFHIYSFLNNRTLSLCSTVNKFSSLIANQMLEKQITDFNIGRDNLKQLCLANPKIAKIGVQTDANRSRYLLLTNDLREIGCAHEELALLMIQCSRLHPRLDRNSLVQFSINFLNVAKRIFNMPEIRGKLKSEDLLEIIEKHQELFPDMIQIDSFINKISNQVTLEKFSQMSEEIALSIIKHPILKNKVYINGLAATASIKHESIALKILKDAQLFSQLDGDEILNLGNTHIEATKIIIENPLLCAQLKEEELQPLQDRVITHVQSISLSK